MDYVTRVVNRFLEKASSLDLASAADREIFVVFLLSALGAAYVVTTLVSIYTVDDGSMDQATEDFLDEEWSPTMSPYYEYADCPLVAQNMIDALEGMSIYIYICMYLCTYVCLSISLSLSLSRTRTNLIHHRYNCRYADHRRSCRVCQTNADHPESFPYPLLLPHRSARELAARVPRMRESRRSVDSLHSAVQFVRWFDRCVGI